MPRNHRLNLRIPEDLEYTRMLYAKSGGLIKNPKVLTFILLTTTSRVDF